MSRRVMRVGLLALVVGMLGPQGIVAGQDGPRAREIEVEPTQVRAGMFFDGATLGISALVPEGLEVTVTCVGKDEPVVLSRKGKVLGLIWMNVGEVEIDGAPDLYLLNSTGLLEEMASTAVLNDLGVGYEALETRATLEGTEGEDDLYFREFVSLKESDGLYTLGEGQVERTAREGGEVRVRAELRLPPKTPPGEYRILIHGFGEAGNVLLGAFPLQVEQVGMAATIRNLATERGLLYGILAVVVAITVGLLTGVLFGLGSKKAH